MDGAQCFCPDILQVLPKLKDRWLLCTGKRSAVKQMYIILNCNIWHFHDQQFHKLLRIEGAISAPT